MENKDNKRKRNYRNDGNCQKKKTMKYFKILNLKKKIVYKKIFVLKLSSKKLFLTNKKERKELKYQKESKEKK